MILGGRERRHGLVDHRLHIGRVDALSVLRDRDFGNGGGNGVGDERLGGFGGHITLKARQFALLKGGDALGEVSVFVAEGFVLRSEEHTSELQSLMRISYAVLCLKKKIKNLVNL